MCAGVPFTPQIKALSGASSKCEAGHLFFCSDFLKVVPDFRLLPHGRSEQQAKNGPTNGMTAGDQCAQVSFEMPVGVMRAEDGAISRVAACSDAHHRQSINALGKIFECEVKDENDLSLLQTGVPGNAGRISRHDARMSDVQERICLREGEILCRMRSHQPGKGDNLSSMREALPCGADVVAAAAASARSGSKCHAAEIHFRLPHDCRQDFLRRRTFSVGQNQSRVVHNRGNLHVICLSCRTVLSFFRSHS